MEFIFDPDEFDPNDFIDEDKEDEYEANFCFECNESPCRTLEVMNEYTEAGRALGLHNRNNRVRYALRRRYVREFHGALGRGVRIKLPSCFERFLRHTWPSRTYVGFRPEGEHGTSR